LSLFPVALVGLVRGWTHFLFKEGTPPPALHKCVRDQHIHLIHASPSFFRLFLAYWNGEPMPTLARLSLAGESAPAALLAQIRTAFPNATIHISFGCTEAGSRVSLISADDARFVPGAVGDPMTYYDIEIHPVEEVPSPAGELLIRGPTVFLGYLGDDGGYHGLQPDGFFATGDLVERGADGCLHYRGRKDGVVKVGGHRLNMYVTEAAIRAIPGVGEVRCLVERHDILGHALAAEVELTDGKTMDSHQLLAAIAGQLEPQQVPREIRIVSKMARTAAGKIARSVP
jgi:acyl-coenzyme A synthetase/AMP-(fatty) acid ligase